MDDLPLEFAEANSVRVLETNILHASDVIYWLDGSSAEMQENMQRLQEPLNIKISQRPLDAKIINTAGRTVFLRRPVNDFVQGIANEADKSRPVMASYSIVGEAWDITRRYNPAKIDVTLNTGSNTGGSDPGEGTSIVVYPSPLGTLKTSAGSIFGNLKIDADQSPLIWAMVTLEVTISVSETQIYRAQTDANGDFTVALKRLPPLPESITQYDAVLNVTANSANTVDTAPDTTTYLAIELESSSANVFDTNFALALVPGECTRVNSIGKEYLAATIS